MPQPKEYKEFDEEFSGKFYTVCPICNVKYIYCLYNIEQFIKKNFIPKSELREIVEITNLDENTPDYEGYSDLVKFGGRFFRTRDAEGYHSSLDEIDEREYNDLLKYKN